MPYISTEVLVGAALIIVLAVGWQFVSVPGSSKSAKKRSKRRAKSTLVDESDRAESPLQVPEKTKKVKRRGDLHPGSVPAGKTQNTDVLHGKPSLPPISGVDAAAPETPSFASVAAISQPTPQPKPKTLAEKIAPKARKTKVDDMLAPEDRPSVHARVMKISGAPTAELMPLATRNDKVAKFEADYTGSENDTSGTGPDHEEDDGWSVVPKKTSKAVSMNMSSSSHPHAGSSTDPLPVATKLQKKNAKKSEANKAAKAEEETERLGRLAMHKKDLEREKINAIYNQSQKKGSTGTGQISGSVGGTATVDAKGKLVWD